MNILIIEDRNKLSFPGKKNFYREFEEESMMNCKRRNSIVHGKLEEYWNVLLIALLYTMQRLLNQINFFFGILG